MQEILFSILVVALNPGEKLQKTVDSILKQGYPNKEIIIKDGMSQDGSIEALEEAYGVAEGYGIAEGYGAAEGYGVAEGYGAAEGYGVAEGYGTAEGYGAAEGYGVAEGYGLDNRLHVIRTPDKSIYDAMNQALAFARGDYVLFLNCGDTFYGEQVLEKTAELIQGKKKEFSAAMPPCIFYGNTLSGQTGAIVHSAPEITGFTCYRNIPCHQSCFYDRRLFEEKQYDTQYRIRADYDHFLWCFYRHKAQMVYMDLIVSAYEGGGYSEDKKNRILDREEQRKVVSVYMSPRELFGYRLIMAVTLAPLRSWMAGNKKLSGIYHKVKSWVYQRTS